MKQRLLMSFVSLFVFACTNPNPPPQGNTDHTQNSSPLSALPTDPSGYITACASHPELCVPRCQRSPKSCATLVNNYLTTKVNNKYRFQNWALFNNKPAKQANLSTPMHGSYLTTYVNDIAANYLDSVLTTPIDQLDTVNFPNGSIIVKQNFTAKTDDPTASEPWLTVMWKLDGYCHASFGGSGPCKSGEWFYYLQRFGEFHDFDGQPAIGKAEAFCSDCHGPVQKSDFLWSLFTQLKAKLPATSHVPSEQAATTNVVKFCQGSPLDPNVPGDVALNPATVITNQGPAQAQLMFDCLSWRSFIALNWPALSTQRGAPDKNKSIADRQKPKVWETYREIFEVFQPANPQWSLDDVDWNSPTSLDPVCGSDHGKRVLRMTSKNRASQVLNETHQAFGNQFNILVDQNGNQLHYEVLVNQDEFEFFKINKYATTGNYDVGGPLSQLNWKSPPLHFPDNVRGKEGAIEIKAAWRVMCTKEDCTTRDDPSQYYTDNVLIYSPQVDGSASCTEATVGLVGMHIGHKTFWAPQWVWSTFEHIHNVPPAGHSAEPGVQYGLYGQTSKANQPDNALCSQQRPGALPPAHNLMVINCPNNQLICNSHPGAINEVSGGPCLNQLTQSQKQNPHAKSLIPNQVTRIDKMSDSPLNTSYPAKLAALNSPLANYRLVNTQWPMNGRVKNQLETTIAMKECAQGVPAPCYKLAPPGLRLRNTTMETFQVTYLTQPANADGQTSSAGCMQCHGMAGLDFSFAWTDAAEEPVLVIQDKLSDPPAGSYRASCTLLTMDAGTLSAVCTANDGSSTQSAPLADAHLCSGDIANINGQLMCNPPLGSFSLSCHNINVNDDLLSASCLTRSGEQNATNLNIAGYHGVIQNCDGVLTKGGCR